MPYPSTSAASDVWSLKDNYNAKAGGTWPLGANPPTSVDMLLVAGGGGTCGNYNTAFAPCGGGGAGAMIVKTGCAVSGGTSYSIAVGAGGAGTTHVSGVTQQGATGGNTTWQSTTIVAKGGGGGAAYGVGANGGSGGGGGFNIYTFTGSGSITF